MRKSNTDLSYTNLAELASHFSTNHRLLPPAATPHQQHAKKTNDHTLRQQTDATTAYADAMVLINAGLRLDATAPLEAVSYYQRGGDILSRFLENAPPDAASEKMQTTLDMVEERVRFISRSMLGRSLSRESTSSASIALPPASI